MGRLLTVVSMVSILLFIVLSCAPSTSSVPPDTSESSSAQETSVDQLTQALVTNVIDGDTIDVDIDGRLFRVRYIGVDTPERGQFGYEEAMIANVQLVSNGIVWLEKDVSDMDIYGRLLRYVWTERGQVNAELVASGYAQVVTYPPDVKYQDDYLELQRQARQAGLGLWVNNQQLEKDKDTFYVASVKSEKYHYPSCKYADQIHPENLITFSSAPKAQARGYVPCTVCTSP